MGTLTFCGELGGEDDGDELFVLLRAGVGGPLDIGWTLTFSFEFRLGKLSVFVQLDKLRTILLVESRIFVDILTFSKYFFCMKTFCTIR